MQINVLERQVSAIVRACADLRGCNGASLPKGPLIQLFGGYEGAKQTLGASREDRARFERAGKIVEQRATVLSRQMKGM